MLESGGSPVAPRWLSMRRACELLGVNAATLRQWTAQGKVPAYVTPGGHRRYDEHSLRALLDRTPASAPSVLPLPLFASHDQYDAVRQFVDAEPWFQTLDAAARQQFRILGNSMLHLLGSYVLADSERERETSLSQAREVASSHGASASAAGMSSTDATQAFLAFRTPVLETMATWSRQQAADSSRLAEMLTRVNLFMDEVLLAMVGAHERHTHQVREHA